jgi:hypothetical protein
MRKGRIEYSVYILDSTADRNFCEAQAHARDVRTQDESFCVSISRTVYVYCLKIQSEV